MNRKQRRAQHFGRTPSYRDDVDARGYARQAVATGLWAPAGTDCDLCAGVPPAWVYQRGACTVFKKDGQTDLPAGPWTLCAQCADDVEHLRWPTLAYRYVDAIVQPRPTGAERERLAEDTSWFVFMLGMRRNDGGPRRPWRQS
jgi:hypothetical protein